MFKLKLSSITPPLTPQERQFLLKLVNGQYYVSFANVLPVIIFFISAVYLCYIFSRHIFFPRSITRNRPMVIATMKQICFITSLINTLILWVGFVFIVDRIFSDLMLQRPPLKIWYWSFNKHNQEKFRLFILYTFALFPAFLIYDWKLRLAFRQLLLNVRINHLDFTEMGRSVYYLHFPPRTDVQQLLTLLDEYYLQASGRRIIKKRKGLRQRTKSLQLVTVSETVAVLARARLAVAAAEAAEEAATLLLRRCKSLESLPNFRPGEYNVH